jgi:lauroyl/myristoyl acyltransferase
VIDRPVERGVEATFFGQRTRVPSGSAVLAVNTGAAIMPGYMWYAVNNRFCLRAFPPMFPRSLSDRAERREEIQRLTQYMLSCQEEVVRSCPTQWFMFRSFWVAGGVPPPGAAGSCASAGRQTNSRRTGQRTKRG